MNLSNYNPKINHLLNSIHDTIEKDPERTLDTCNELIREGTQLGDSSLMGIGFFYSGNVYYALNEGDLFFESITKALSYLVSAQEWELMARCYNLLGILFINNGNVPVALDYYSKARDLSENHGLEVISIVIWINLSSVYILCEWYEEAFYYVNLAYEHMKLHSSEADYISKMFAIMHNREKCMVVQEKYSEVEKIREEIRSDLWDKGDDMDRMVICFVDTLYYHKCKKEKERDEAIEWIDRHLPDTMPLMNIADDFYEYCQILIACGKKEEFWRLVNLIDAEVAKLNLTNILRQEMALKIQFYRKNKQYQHYLESAGIFYELTELMEAETKRMNNNVLALRQSLASAKCKEKAMEQQNRILLEKSQTDPLTKLGNRNQLNDYFERAFEHAVKSHTSVAIEILDVDYFKEYNDNYGHQNGDTCLITVANILDHMKRWHNAYCARYGGDEFIVIYQGLTQEQVIENARIIRQKIQDARMEHLYSRAYPIVTLSQGLCWGIPNEDDRMWDFLHTADDMLYHVKNSGRNNYCFCEINSPMQYVMGGL